MRFISHIDDLRIRGKFNLLLGIQILALILVGGIGWMTVSKLQVGQVEISEQLVEAAALSRVLNDMNLVRAAHISLMGAPRIRNMSQPARRK